MSQWPGVWTRFELNVINSSPQHVCYTNLASEQARFQLE